MSLTIPAPFNPVLCSDYPLIFIFIQSAAHHSDTIITAPAMAATTASSDGRLLMPLASKPTSSRPPPPLPGGRPSKSSLPSSSGTAVLTAGCEGLEVERTGGRVGAGCVDSGSDDDDDDDDDDELSELLGGSISLAVVSSATSV